MNGLTLQCKCGEVYKRNKAKAFSRMGSALRWKCPGCGLVCDDSEAKGQPYRIVLLSSVLPNGTVTYYTRAVA